MNEKQIAAIVADETDNTEKEIREIFETTKQTILNNLLEGEKEEVRFPRFGKFTVREVEEQKNRRIGPRIVDIPRQDVLDFQPFGNARKRFD